MTLDEILEQWETDAEIDNYDLETESVKINKLHKKYLKLLVEARRTLNDAQERIKITEYRKFMLYSGKLDSKEQLEAWGLKPFGFTILKTDVQMVLDGDEEIVEKRIAIKNQIDKIKAIEEIIKSIHQRTYMIKNAIDEKKFKAGVY
jgi:predicted PP-loop superfamily ATPase